MDAERAGDGQRRLWYLVECSSAVVDDVEDCACARRCFVFCLYVFRVTRDFKHFPISDQFSGIPSLKLTAVTRVFCVTAAFGGKHAPCHLSFFSQLFAQFFAQPVLQLEGCGPCPSSFPTKQGTSG